MMRDINHLMMLRCALNITILAVVEVLANDYLQRLTEMLSDFVTCYPTLARIYIRKVWSLDGDTIPRMGETGTDDAPAIEGLRDDAEKTLDKRAAADADAVAEVAIALAAGSVIIADLSEIGWRGTVVHLVKDVGFYQLVSLISTSGLEEG